MKFIFTDKFLLQYRIWKKSQKRVADKIDALIESIKNNPVSGIGKPEKLKNNSRNIWSRRIDKQNRLLYSFEGFLIYAIDDGTITFISCKGHYER